jgi:hypothetical protein
MGPTDRGFREYLGQVAVGFTGTTSCGPPCT